jgi:regulatory protein
LNTSEEFNFYLQKLANYCAYRERCTSEVHEKMNKLNVPECYRSEMVKILIEQNYLNESRFAEAYCRGKLRNNSWGKRKIFYQLKALKIPEQLIKHSILNIDPEEYEEKIKTLIFKNVRKYGNPRITKNKLLLMKYLYQKGFETESIERAIIELINSGKL